MQIKSIKFTNAAAKQMRALDRPVQLQIRQKLAQYAQSPPSLVNQVKRLKGSGALRLRVGDYRVIFTEDGQILLILRVGHRKNVYE
ncbi:MAG: type II toxin-antitoxin system RelE/ParE family toxin [Sphingomonadales bacterium]|nr:type II toxin-antitoxin system RelE/ParE family toxin [Sphingomonadales bacterium]